MVNPSKRVRQTKNFNFEQKKLHFFLIYNKMVESHNVIGIKLYQSQLLQIANFRHFTLQTTYHETPDDDLLNYDFEEYFELHPSTEYFRSVDYKKHDVLNAAYYFGIEIPSVNPTLDEIRYAQDVAIQNIQVLKEYFPYLTYDAYIVFPTL